MNDPESSPASAPPDAQTWVRLPLATLNTLFDQRFNKLEQEASQLRQELAETRTALASVHGAIAVLSDEMQRQTAMTQEQLRTELGRLSAAFGALRDGGTVTVRTQEVTMRARSAAPPGWAAKPALPPAAGETVSPRVPPPPPRQKPVTSRQFRKPTYAAPAPAPPAARPPAPKRPPAQARARAGGDPAPAAGSAQPTPRPARVQPPRARRIRQSLDRALRWLGVEPPQA